MKLNVADALRAVKQWGEKALKSAASIFHLHAGMSLTDSLANLAAQAEVTADQINEAVQILPVSDAIKDEVKLVLTKAAPLLHKAEDKVLLNSIKKGLSTEIVWIITGKVHDIKQIEADVQALFDSELQP